ncbi:tyrosine-protein phosphatase [Rhizobium hidalgonense]|uniref:Protein tyrosine phosphatase n=1 Tax=Rhizobium hidalgonense TaxID=1538159 RepID=A0ABX4JMV8_9HYPH|nr:tyrosine-protein phosphatase [Rhizobium hidalgonense]PDT21230.1 protein tyrosine phosphatase [Rhizobium hidalgonense]PON07881.1 protein tyrosine phosphatase [Rhizobium hidalgonense]
MKLSKILKAILCYGGTSVIAIAAVIAGYVGWLNLSGNFNGVVSGEIYRSAQPTAAALSNYAKEYGIRSIINLRGQNIGKPWYDEEVAASSGLGITHYDFRMSAGSIVTLDKAEQLIALMTKAEKPLLIHCQAGADRSGLASALYLAAIAKAGEAAAESQISLRYGHFSVPYLSAAYPMDVSFEQLEPWLGFARRSVQ